MLNNNNNNKDRSLFIINKLSSLKLNSVGWFLLFFFKQLSKHSIIQKFKNNNTNIQTIIQTTYTQTYKHNTMEEYINIFYFNLTWSRLHFGYGVSSISVRDRDMLVSSLTA